MKQLNFLDQIFEADFIYKTNDSIIGMKDGNEAFSFRGISNFSLFTLNEGQEFDAFEKTADEKLVDLENENNSNMMALVELFEQNIKMQEENIMLKKSNEILQEENNSTMLAITELYEIVLSGGTV